MAKRKKNWRRIPGCSGGTCGATWFLLDPITADVLDDYRVHHCGHPTALWPYYGVVPGDDCVIAPNGRAFRHLVDAQTEIERRYRKNLTRNRETS